MTLTAEGIRTITCNVEFFSFTGRFHILGDLNQLKNAFRNLPPSKMLLTSQRFIARQSKLFLSQLLAFSIHLHGVCCTMIQMRAKISSNEDKATLY